MKKRFVVAALCAAALVSVGFAAPASAAGTTVPQHVFTPKLSTVADSLFTPLSLAVDNAGNSYVSQNFSGQLVKITKKGAKSTVASAPGWEIGAVSERSGTVYFAKNKQEEGKAYLMVLPRHGTEHQVADLGAYEAANNPDQVNSYGFVGLSDECAAQFDPNGPIGPATYTGIVDSHPYASVATKQGVYVADAGANAILKVDGKGTISTVAVLPPTPPIVASQEMAAGLGIPDCAVGHKYWFESVPTDVEVGPFGWLYVTSLPGGPEDASLGARGAVYKVNPNTGKVVSVASGFVGATDLAVDARTGVMLVTELFGGKNGTGQVSLVLPWMKKAVSSFEVSSPAAIEFSHNKVYLTQDAFVPDANGAPQAIGKLVVVNPRSMFGNMLW